MAFGLKNTTELAERRRAQRESVDVAVIARTLVGDHIPLRIEVLSSGGFLASTERAVPKGCAIDVIFPTARAVRVQVVWVEDGRIGCKFAVPAHLPDLLKSAEARADIRNDRRSFGREKDTDGVETRPAQPGNAPWLDQFGWLPIDSHATPADGEHAYLRPVLLRSGSRWAFGCLSAGEWVHMSESRLGDELDFAPTLWTPVSDDRAADLSDL